MTRVAVGVCIAAVVLSLSAASAASATPGGTTIWFAPLPPLPTHSGRPYIGSSDFMQLFRKKAAWPRASRRVSVFKLYGEWVAHAATPAQLRRAVVELKRRKISIAVETGPLEPPPDCGQGVEGFSGTEGIRTATRIKEAGGTLTYLAFDEPFYYAALYAGPSACHWDVRQVARGVAAYVRSIRTVFPNVKFGDIEPLTSIAQVQSYERWLEAYRDAVGEDVSFVHLDVAYTLPTWVQAARELEDFARSRGVAFGLIYFGDADALTDRAWLARAQQRFELYETEGGRPADAIFQSWQDKPDHVLPETKPTFTNLILRYTRTRPRLELDAGAGIVEGRLTASRPIGGARVRLSVERTFAGSAYASRKELATFAATTRLDGRFRAEFTGAARTAIAARYAGSPRYWPAYAATGARAELRNVARGRPVVASAEEPTSLATSAVDGDTTTSWNAGQFGPQWIEVDLGAPYAIAAIRLGIAQTPPGHTVHAVLGRPSEGPYRELQAFSGTTADNGLLEYVPPVPWEEVRYVRVETRTSPSWVSWRELELFVAD